MELSLDVGYMIAFFLGLGYALVSGAINLLGGGDHDVGGHGMDVGHGLDVGHDHEIGHGGHAADGAVDFSPISPVTISFFVAAFGGTGLILSRVCHLPGLLSLPISTVSGFIVAAGVFYLFFKIFRMTQGSSESRVADLVGLEAEVITAIPEEGVGQIAYVSKGSRYTATARAEDRKAHPANSAVVIRRIVGSMFCVASSLDEDLRSLGGEKERDKADQPSAKE
ncbi:MAG: NfeD family protein [Planctomycetota bacterium]